MNRKTLFLLAGVVIPGLISSCMIPGNILGLSNQSKEKHAASGTSSEIAILLSYNKHLKGLAKERLEEERTKAEKALTDFNAPIHRLRLAMILSLSEPGSKDYVRAQSLLAGDSEGESKPDPVLKDFSIFLASSLLRLEKEAARHQAVNQKLKEQALREQELSQKIIQQDNQNQKLLQQLKGEEEQRQKLQKMIEELKTIEKNIMNDKNIMKRDNGDPAQ